MKVKDISAVITGGASGLGKAVAQVLSECGAKQAILDLQGKEGERLSKELGDNTIFIRTDITNEENVQDAIRAVAEQFGRINFVVNCAAIFLPEKLFGKKGMLSLDNFNRQLQINVIGMMSVIRYAVEQMVKNVPNEDGERGIIVNTSSVAAFEGQIGQSAYSASKAAIVGMMLPLARELSEFGIRVVTIVPGLFDTPMRAALTKKASEEVNKLLLFPKRAGKPSEFANLVRHIAENPMFNGAIIRIDGGTSTRSLVL